MKQSLKYSSKQLAIFFCLVCFTGCKDKELEQPQIAVTIPTMKAFVQKLVGTPTPVLVLLPPSASPVHFMPKIQMLSKFSKIQLYFQSGLPFEMSWEQKLQSIATNARFINLTQVVGPTPSTDHTHLHIAGGGINPHIWLSPAYMKKIVRLMADSLITIMPSHKSKILTNVKKEIQAITRTDQRVRKILSTHAQKSFLVYHPSFYWFAKTYGLNMISIEKDGSQAKHKHLQHLIELAQKEQIKTIISQPEFSSRQVNIFATKLQARVVTLTPLHKNWHEMMVCLAHYIGNQKCQNK